MRTDYLLKRAGLFLLILWLASTVNFILPRLGGQNPIRAQLGAQAAMGGASQIGARAMIEEYDKRFGLDRPLWEQYVSYLTDTLRFEFNFSMSSYPTKVVDIIWRSMPWTITLLGVTTLMAWTLGTVLGALLTQPNAPRILRFILAPILTLSAIPFFLLGLLLIYLLGFQLKWFPLAGGYDQGLLPAWDPKIIWNMVYHSILPALSIILASVGFWTLGMRGVMVSTQGEDYLLFAEAKGLRGRTIFLRYAIRNALLPQLTALALALGNIVPGAVLVEVIFQYPGVGSLLYQSIRASDFYMIQGLVFIIIVAIGLATLVLDLIYPLLDHAHHVREEIDTVATVAREQTLTAWGTRRSRLGDMTVGTLRYLRRNPELVIGLCLIAALLAFVVIGQFMVDLDKARPLSSRPLAPPSPGLPLGSDRQGRNLLAVMVLGTPQTLAIGIVAGLIGVTIGTVLALVAAFYRGVADAFIRGVVDIGLTIPGLMVLVTLAMNVKGGLTIPQMILVVAALAWLFPARVIRAQVLSVRERAFIDVARLSGAPMWAIIVTEVLPNLMPYIVASLVGSVSAAVLASVGLEVLGLGSFDSVTIGMTLYWVIYYAAIINSWWWWWLPPMVIIIVLFTALFMMAVGLDEFADPRLRRRV